MSTPTPGWYADPAGTPQLRWWDGNQWTDQYRGGDAPAANAASSAPAAAANAGPSAPTPHFTPVTSIQPRMTGGQIAIAIVLN